LSLDIESQSHFFSPLFAVFHILNQLLSIAGAHVRVLVPHPIINQDLSAIRPEQHRFAEPAERIEANVGPSHPPKDCRQTVPEKALRSKLLASEGSVLEQVGIDGSNPMTLVSDADASLFDIAPCGGQ